VLLLDEPVEGLDSPTAQRVLRDLSDRDPGVSWLLLAHRPEGLDLVDEVWHLDGGRLTAVIDPVPAGA
jgi:ATP-binding cassette subfamily C protein CydCD